MDKDRCPRIAFEILFWWVVLVTTETYFYDETHSKKGARNPAANIIIP